MALAPSGLKTNLATTTYVNETVARYIPTGTVTDITLGKGLAGTNSTITTSGTIGLSATLDDLNNVSIVNPQTNDVLMFNGSEWITAVFSGSGSSPLAATQLIDFPPTFASSNGGILTVNNEGTSIFADMTKYASTVVDGVGIASNMQENTVRMDLNLNTLTEVYDADSSTYITVVNSDGNQGKIKSSGIELQNFYNKPGGTTEFLTNGSVSAAAPMIWDSSMRQFSISPGALTTIDFDTDTISGVLGIPNGGTSGSTAEEARDFLGVSYNRDVLYCTNPSYTGTLNGGNILISSDTITGAAINNPGTCYIAGYPYYILIDGVGVSVNITSTGPGGQISGFNIGDPSGILRGKLGTETIPNETVYGASPGLSGTINVQPNDLYINFGLSEGEDGFGIRYSVPHGSMQFKTASTGPWANNIPFTLEEAIDVTGAGSAGPSTNGELLIWNPVDQIWGIKNVYGDITINSDGGTSLTTGAIEATRIGLGTVDNTEFSYLDGVSSNIQSQLNDKITIPASTPGDLLYYNATGSSWVPLHLGTSIRVLTSGTSLTQPVWNDISVAFTEESLPSGTSTNVNIAYFIDSGVGSHTGSGKQTNFGEILTNYIAETGGLDHNSDNQLVTSIVTLPTGTIDTTTDIISFQNPTDSFFDKQATISEFCSSIAGNGLGEASGQLFVSNAPQAGQSWGTGVSPWSQTYTDMMILATGYANHTVLPTGADTGSIVYVTDGGGGNAALGVYDGTTWKKISLTTF